MPRDPFYLTPEWRARRRAVLERAGGRCEAPGCDRPAVIVDHILARSKGGSDDPANLRCLCRQHDNSVKEDQHGNRRSGGVLRTRPRIGPDGWPIT